MQDEAENGDTRLLWTASNSVAEEFEFSCSPNSQIPQASEQLLNEITSIIDK